MDDDSFDSESGFQEESLSAIVDEIELERHQSQLKSKTTLRELRRLRNSSSLRIGILIVSSIEKPWKLLFLPLTFPWLLFSIGLERLGKKSPPQIDYELGMPAEKRNSVVFFPTNGVGFGHFTRMYALAKRMKRDDPDLEIVFFTTMPTVHLLYQEGYITYHLSGRKKHGEMSSSQWNALVEENLSLVFSHHNPEIFIFDGAFPYRGMLNAIKGRTDMQKLWMRRGTFRKGSKVPIDSITHFDLLIHPEDSVAMQTSQLNHGVKELTCPPITLLDENELMTRESALRRLGIEQTAKVVYVQLGAGRINDIDSEVRMTINSLLENNCKVVVGESMLGDRLNIDIEGVIVIRDYPNSMYFNAFDATVQAGGYNSYHETRRFGLPALFYPNMNTGMDDQLARCNVSSQEGWGIVVENRTEENIANGVKSLLALKIIDLPKQKNGADVLSLVLNKQLTS